GCLDILAPLRGCFTFQLLRVLSRAPEFSGARFFPTLLLRAEMIDKADHIACAAEALEVFQRHCGTSEKHAIADLICDLGHLAEERGQDFLSEVQRGIAHWYTEQNTRNGHALGPDATVEIFITPR